MGSVVIVVAPPCVDDEAGMTEAFEEVFVQAFIPQPAVEAFDEAVLHRLAGGDEVPGHAAFPAPSEHGVGGKLRPVIRDEHAGLASKLDELIQLARNPDA